MKYTQTSLPFLEKSGRGTKKKIQKFSLNRDKFIQYLLKSVEINIKEAETLFVKIKNELEKYAGKDDIAFLEKLLSENIGKWQVKKPLGTTSIHLTENAKIILQKRYLLKNEKGGVIETPEQLFRRVAKAIAAADLLYDKKAPVKETEDSFYQMLANLEFLPNSPTLMNGGKKDGQLSACFVLPINDSMESIFETLTQTAFIQKTGGGTGFNFSKIRPKNSAVHSTHGTASGPLSFISMFNAVTDTIKQGGTRRGANMAILNVEHPDILEFIHSKEERGALVNFNISVAVTDAFMAAVEKGEAYELIHPQTGEAVETLNAKKVFNEIIQAAWKTGDPGLIFIDRINASNPTPQAGRIESTNPCVTGDTYISTEKGLIKIIEIAKNYPDRKLRIATDPRVEKSSQESIAFFPINRAFSSGKKHVFHITTASGFELRATDDHIFLTADGWKKLETLVPEKDYLFLQSSAGKFNPESKLPIAVQNHYVGENGREYTLNMPQHWSRELGQVLGWLVGDGWLREDKKNSRVGLTFGRDDRDVLNHFMPILNQWYNSDIKIVERENGTIHLSYHSKFFVQFFKALGLKSWLSHEKEVPETLFNATEDTVIGFLQGLFSSDGTVRKNPKPNSGWIALTSKSKALLKGVQLLLLNSGIVSKLYDRSRPPRKNVFSYRNSVGEEKNYDCDGILYELGIFGKNREIFRQKIGFLNKHKQDGCNAIPFKGFYRRSFKDKIVSIEPSGIEDVYDLTEPFTHSMIANGLVTHQCGEQPLLPYESCNLGSINLNAVLKTDASIDWEKLGRITERAVHFLDNVIDVNCYPLPQIAHITKANRKIGLGIMGLADVFVKMEIPYNSNKALDVAEKLISFIREKAIETSQKLAEKRGPFPNFTHSLLDQPGKKPIRNATVVTIAPTGTLSLIAGCSSGIEPIFARSFVKNVLEGEKLPETYPDHVVTAHEISPEWHVRMQALFQKYSDNAVSKTVNLPFEAPAEAVEKAYWLAYKLDCKGITIYRDQSKATQVLQATSTNVTELLKKKLKGSLQIMPEKSGKIKIQMNVDSDHPENPELFCPECHTLFKHEEGCTFCPECGYMHCHS